MLFFVLLFLPVLLLSVTLSVNLGTRMGDLTELTQQDSVRKTHFTGLSGETVLSNGRALGHVSARWENLTSEFRVPAQS